MLEWSIIRLKYEINFFVFYVRKIAMRKMLSNSLKFHNQNIKIKMKFKTI